MWWCAALLSAGCGPDAIFVVDLRTDFVPGLEFTEVTTRITRDGAERRADAAVSRGADTVQGVRVAQLDGVAQGTWLVEVQLLDEGGAQIASGRVLTDVGGGSRSVTVVVTRDCRGVRCAEGLTCVDGGCQDLRCSPENLGACPAGCAADSECAPTGASCVVGRCLDRTCFDVADDGLCGGGTCDPVDGCSADDAGVSADAGVPVTPLSGVERLALGGAFSCAGTATGHRCWGDNSRGQFGDGTTTSRLAPGPEVVTGFGSIGLSAGCLHMCAVSREVYCWGDNSSGQLGVVDGLRATPTLVSLGGVAGQQLAAGPTHTCVAGGGTVVGPGFGAFPFWCWGGNAHGQLGDGTTVYRAEPAAIPVMWGVISAAAGEGHTCAIDRGAAGRRLFCWGSNLFGQLGDGTGFRRTTPTAVPLTGEPLLVAANTNHTCVIQVDGSVSCWGDNRSGQAGGGAAEYPTPQPVPGIGDAQTICAGAAHTCVTRASGLVSCWGSNAQGQLGDGTDTDRSAPTEVLAITDATAVACGTEHTCALLADGSVTCWGDNTRGQLGDGSRVSSSTPVEVVGP